jgi:hypothetical protein
LCGFLLAIVPALAKLNHTVIQGCFLTVANVNIVPVTVPGCLYDQIPDRRRPVS